MHVNDTGMRDFISRLAKLHSCSYGFTTCDTHKILGIMSDISGLTQDQILFPYRNDPNFSQDVKPLVRNKLTQSEVDKILSDYTKQNPSSNNSSTSSLILGFIILGVGAAIVIFGVIWGGKLIYRKVFKR